MATGSWGLGPASTGPTSKEQPPKWGFTALSASKAQSSDLPVAHSHRGSRRGAGSLTGPVRGQHGRRAWGTLAAVFSTNNQVGPKAKMHSLLHLVPWAPCHPAPLHVSTSPKLQEGHPAK